MGACWVSIRTGTSQFGQGLNLFSQRGTALDLNQHGKYFFVNTLLYICNCRATTSLT